MIAVCMDGARVVMERWKQFLLSKTGVFLYSAATGAIGVAILLVFLSLVLSPGALFLLLPVIIGFNSASSGYGLADKWPAGSRKKIALVTLAVLFTAVGCLGVALLYPWEKQMDGFRILLSGGAAFGGILFGAWIAGKKQKLQDK